jgi:hypothetical protein
MARRRLDLIRIKKCTACGHLYSTQILQVMRELNGGQVCVRWVKVDLILCHSSLAG